MNAALARKDAPGAVLLVVQGDRVVFHKAYGHRSVEPSREPMEADTLFDLASLTKPLATASLVHLLAERRGIDLAGAVGRAWPELAGAPVGAATVEQLLLHTSGLDAALPLDAYRKGTPLLEVLASLPLATRPGEASRYSDLGYELLGELAVHLGGKGLARLFAEHIAGPLGTPSLTFNPGPELRARAAPTERRASRWLAGEVHDPRAARLGGAAGHAGLFGTASDLARFCRMLLGGGVIDGRRVLTPRVAERLLAHRKVPKGTRTLGWDVSSGMLTSRGDVFPPRGVGHLGFTGTSIWMDPPTRTASVLLTSRLHPDGKGNVNQLRRETGTAVGRRALGPPLSPGIDALLSAPPTWLREGRLGLLTHAAATDGAGRRGVDALLAAGARLVALFTPEHGLESKADSAVGDGRDAASGLPVHSLYGDRRRPTAEQLAGIDALLIDLQDAGCRFYTYASTLGYALEEAAKSKVRVVVLDRPNPLGGEATEGPGLDAGRSSFVGYHSIPVRHGLTMGELARLFNEERAIGASLDVVAMRGWRRAMRWADTGLPWRNPSPNLRSAHAALLYPGVGLLEMTNLSVGRGTERPFEQVGAPWIDGAALAAALGRHRLPGLRVSPTRFTPTASAFAREECGGVAFSVADPPAFEPLRLGVALALELRRRDAWKPERLDVLLGHRATQQAILRGDGLDAIVASWQPELAAFSARRARHLLYPPAG